jgi:VWFA-related protein
VKASILHCFMVNIRYARRTHFPMLKRATLALAVLAGSAVVVASQTPQTPPTAPPQFRSTSELVRLDVSVLNGDREPVVGLDAGDFRIFENGKEQTLSAFAEVNVPQPIVPTTPWMRDVDPDIKRNDNLNERRLILIVLDDAQVPFGNVRIAENVKAAGRAIIDHLGPADLAGVVYTVDQRNQQEFTTDRTKLLAAIDRFVPGADPNMGELFDRYSVGALARAAEFLAEIPQRRKAMFYISTGVRVDLAGVAAPVSATIRNDTGNDRVGQTSILMQEMQDVFKQAQIANVNIHAVDPSAMFRSAGANGFFNPEKDFLISVSENTGGFPIINSDDYDDAIGQVFRENSSYYLLGYEPQIPDDGKFRRTEVRVNRPGLTVRARSGYYAPDAIKATKSNASGKPGPSPLWKAISGLLPIGDLPLQVTAAPYAIAGKKEAAVAVVLGIVQDVHTGDTRQTEHIDFLVDAFGQDGSSKSAHGLKADVVFKPNVIGKVGYEVLTRIDLKPGRYQLRLSAHLPSQDTSGSIYYDVDVPDFSKGNVVLSGAMLSVTPSLVAAPRDRLSDILPIVPTTNRYFSRTDEVTSFVRIYQPKGSIKPIAMTARVTDSAGTVVVDRTGTIPVSAFARERSASYRMVIPVGTLTPGAYLLSFDASNGAQTDARNIRFVVK